MSKCKQTLQNTVSSANNANELTHILQKLPLDAVKAFVNQQIEELNPKDCRNLYYQTSSIDTILSDDITKYILSFGDLHNTKAVNKDWNNKSNQIENMEMKKLYDKHCNHEQRNETWIVHPYRNTLNDAEIQLGFKGIVKSIGAALGKETDRIFIHNGMYKEKKMLDIKSSVDFIGVGSNVNIQARDGFIEIHPDIQNPISMRNCKVFGFKNRSSVIVMRSSSLIVESCQFEGAKKVKEHGSAIALGHCAKSVKITKCQFRNCGKYGCIRVYRGNRGSDNIKLQCIGNVFANNPGIPVTGPNVICCVLKDNMLKKPILNQADPN
eukprot:551238_1